MNSSENTLMKQFTFPRIAVAVIIVSLLCGGTTAQEQTAPQTDEQKSDEQSVPKVEVGVQYSQLSFFGYNNQYFGFINQSHAVGGRLTYNLTDRLAVEAEANFFPYQKTVETSVSGGRPFQAQFGVKAGKRFRRIGLFVKARPGFITFGQTSTPTLGPSYIGFDGREYFTLDSITQRKTHLTLDVGGVLEVYASRRVFARLDAGDTMIRYGRHDDYDFTGSGRNIIAKAPSITQHNLQFGAGVGFRLGALGDVDDDAAVVTTPRSRARNAATRFEAGAQFTALSFTPIRQIRGDIFISSPPTTLTELGFGGRVTYNLTGDLAVEAETNLLPRKIFLGQGASGRVTQGQFGIKAGRRFHSFGLFGKVRPGFVSFGSSSTQVGLDPFIFADRLILRGAFEIKRRTFFSADVGGVLELYPSRRWLVRLDAGDTVIHYGARSINTVYTNPPVIVAPPETRHNFQFTIGVGFRF
jgi:hypothetical protein